MRSRGRSRLLPHLPSDNTFSGPRIDDAPGIDLFAFLFVAVVDAIPLDDRSVAIYLLVNDTRCAVRRPGDGEPLTGLRILDRVTLWISASGTCSVACSELIALPGLRGGRPSPAITSGFSRQQHRSIPALPRHCRRTSGRRVCDRSGAVAPRLLHLDVTASASSSGDSPVHHFGNARTLI